MLIIWPALGRPFDVASGAISQYSEKDGSSMPADPTLLGEVVMATKTVLSATNYTNLVKEIRALVEEGLTDNAGYRQAILNDLAEELDIDASTLPRCVHFFQAYKTAASSSSLTWSHYKHRLPIHDEEERQWYEDLTTAEGFNVAQLLRIDLRFQVWKEQRVRLANIDALAMDRSGDKEACQFVLKQLTQAEFVMVKINKIDIYGRYVGHIFYSPKALSKENILAKGCYLNQELVSEGLARIL